jgi:hypothetical protein
MSHSVYFVSPKATTKREPQPGWYVGGFDGVLTPVGPYRNREAAQSDADVRNGVLPPAPKGLTDTQCLLLIQMIAAGFMVFAALFNLSHSADMRTLSSIFIVFAVIILFWVSVENDGALCHSYTVFFAGPIILFGGLFLIAYARQVLS